RMTKLLEAGRGDEIVQETRGWDENTDRTFSQRVKESSDDYRYFPEPDLPKMNLHEVFDLDKLKEGLPELPWEKKERLTEKYGINEESASIFVTDSELGEFFDEVSKDQEKDFVKLAANYITSDVVSIRKEGGNLPEPESFAKIINMLLSNDVSSRGAKDILAILSTEGGDPEKIAEEKGLKQESDEGALGEMVEQIISENETAVEEFKAGKEASLQFLIGQGMKLSKGSANPQMLKKIFEEKLK
ncbi:Asp-tRNA(Asn)/Glu-tRNA(Gln) amidotransferase subunit GatB, partial [Candidatus Pacebacteria bacterium]|nr:Asp-tRNA(Asn)/Glu-tRNA(Gln) amidotransferase subunit GatB [Candidatus Paceibacterota bacterium]